MAISTLPGGPFLNPFTPLNAQELREGHTVKAEPHVWQHRANLIHQLIGLQRFAEAMEQIEAGSREGIADKADVSALKGIVLVSSGRQRDALEPLTEAIELDDDSYLRELRADIYFQLEMYNEAEGDYQKCLLLKRGISAHVTLKLADTLIRCGKDKEAIKHLEEVIRYSTPTDVEALAKLALILGASRDERIRDPKAAIEIAANARKNAKSEAAIIASESALAIAQAGLGDFESAVLHQSRAISAQTPPSDEMVSRLELFKTKKAYTFPPEKRPVY